VLEAVQHLLPPFSIRWGEPPSAFLCLLLSAYVPSHATCCGTCPWHELRTCQKICKPRLMERGASNHESVCTREHKKAVCSVVCGVQKEGARAAPHASTAKICSHRLLPSIEDCCMAPAWPAVALLSPGMFCPRQAELRASGCAFFGGLSVAWCPASHALC